MIEGAFAARETIHEKRAQESLDRVAAGDAEGSDDRHGGRCIREKCAEEDSGSGSPAEGEDCGRDVS